MNLVMSTLATVFLAATALLAADDIAPAVAGFPDTLKRVTLRPGPEMERAEFFVWKPGRAVDAALVLCPGCNGSGEAMVRDPAWREFASKHRLGLVGLSFASAPALLTSGRGYYYASRGSGELLREGVRHAFVQGVGESRHGGVQGVGESRNGGSGDLPLLLYGFSGGAHFTARFVEWKPESVIAWCAYSAGWWDIPQRTCRVQGSSPLLGDRTVQGVGESRHGGVQGVGESRNACPALAVGGVQEDTVETNGSPPGIVACGDEDERYGASLFYFKQGRALGKPWLWISVPKTGHAVAAGFEEFVRSYFAAALTPREGLNPGRARMIARRGAENAEGRGRGDPRPDGVWLDIDRETEADTATVRTMPTVTAWLPDRQLLQGWMNVHEP